MHDFQQTVFRVAGKSIMKESTEADDQETATRFEVKDLSLNYIVSHIVSAVHTTIKSLGCTPWVKGRW